MTRRRMQSRSLRPRVVALDLLASALRPVAELRRLRRAGTSRRPRTWSPPPRPAPRGCRRSVWAVYRDVNSLDPAFAFDYPENTAISLMCESLLLQKADGAIAPGLATLTHSHPEDARLHDQPAGHVLGRPPGHPGGRRLQPRPADEPEPRRLLRRGLQPGQVDRADRHRTRSRSRSSSPTTGSRASCRRWPGIVIEKSYAQARARTTAPRPAASCAPGRTSSSPGRRAPGWSPWPTRTTGGARPRWSSRSRSSGVPDNNDLTAGLETGAIQGTYASGGIPTLDQLRQAARSRSTRGRAGPPTR